mmetsp:Transcript_29397/g.54198  ORF Transcript_29397/g.54198 Transcript_29397/m.54198 type:complete len:200 (-) Transcript_29397:295-894(-)
MWEQASSRVQFVNEHSPSVIWWRIQFPTPSCNAIPTQHFATTEHRWWQRGLLKDCKFTIVLSLYREAGHDFCFWVVHENFAILLRTSIYLALVRCHASPLVLALVNVFSGSSRYFSSYSVVNQNRRCFRGYCIDFAAENSHTMPFPRTIGNACCGYARHFARCGIINQQLFATGNAIRVNGRRVKFAAVRNESHPFAPP